MKFYFSSINLGCNKNLVDLEFIIGEILSKTGNKDMDIRYFESPEDDEVDFVIINTCGFLSTSREEAENTITDYDSLGKKIIIVGCYIQVASNDFLNNLKNLYKIIPFVDYNSVSDILNLSKDNTGFVDMTSEFIKGRKLEKFIDNIKSNQTGKKAFLWKGDEVRAYMNSPYGYEYLKISEGCDNNCTFCIIPKIRGKQKSRTIEEILSEVKVMVDNGIKEIILIAQDTTRYGSDIYENPKLMELLEKIEMIESDFKYRLLYMYPDNLTNAHIDKLKTFKKFIPYFDIPFQHISVEILKKMGRYYDQNSIYDFLDHIKSNFPVHFLRTSFIIGFPGETDDDQKELKNFIKKYEFDSVALFEYHDEQLASSSKLEPKIDNVTSRKRIDELDVLLNKIYKDKSLKEKGKSFSGYIEGFEDGKYLLRRELRCPEIDEIDYVKKSHLIKKGDFKIGDFVQYKV